MKKTVDKILKVFFTHAIIPVVVSVSTFLITKDKYTQEVKSFELNNVEQTLTIYKRIINDLDERLTDQKNTIIELQIELRDLKANCKTFLITSL